MRVFADFGLLRALVAEEKEEVGLDAKGDGEKD